MTWALLVITSAAPAAVLGVVWSLIPSEDDPPRWRTALAGRLERIAARLRRQRPVQEPLSLDPFRTLRLQSRLGAVADQVRQLEADDRAFARAERIVASQLAYDQLLAEACRLAGVEVDTDAAGDPRERFREEVELASRGWTW